MPRGRGSIGTAHNPITIASGAENQRFQCFALVVRLARVCVQYRTPITESDHMELAQSIVMAVQIWGGIGLSVATVFLTVGVDRIDEDARGAYIFRPLLIPGVMLIWPLVLWRWWQIETQNAPWAARYRAVRGWYGAAILAMSIGIVVIIATGLSVRQTWPADAAPVQLGAGDKP